MKKVLVFASSFPLWKGDWQGNFIYELSKRLTKDFDISILTPSYPGAKDFEVMDKMKVHRFHYFIRKYEKLAGGGGILPTLKKNKWFYFQIPFFLFGEFLALRKQIKENRPDIIHAHWIIPQGFVAALIKKFYGVDYVVTTWGGDMFAFTKEKLSFKILKKIYSFVLKNSRVSTTVNQVFLNEMRSIIENKEQAIYIPNGTNIHVFNPNKKDNSIKKKYNIKGPFLLFVGRLSEKKGVEYLIKAMPEVIKKNSKTKLIIIGKGELEKKLKNLSKKLKVDNNTLFIGEIPNKDLPRYYATADLFIGPSIVTNEGDREGFPTVFIESMSSGTPILATNIDGITEMIQEGKNGYVVFQKDSEQISKKINYFLSNRHKSVSLKINSRESALKKYSWDFIKLKYSQILK